MNQKENYVADKEVPATFFIALMLNCSAAASIALYAAKAAGFRIS